MNLCGQILAWQRVNVFVLTNIRPVRLFVQTCPDRYLSGTPIRTNLSGQTCAVENLSGAMCKRGLACYVASSCHMFVYLFIMLITAHTNTFVLFGLLCDMLQCSLN